MFDSSRAIDSVTTKPALAAGFVVDGLLSASQMRRAGSGVFQFLIRALCGQQIQSAGMQSFQRGAMADADDDGVR